MFGLEANVRGRWRPILLGTIAYGTTQPLGSAYRRAAKLAVGQDPRDAHRAAGARALEVGGEIVAVGTTLNVAADLTCRNHHH